MRNCEVAVSLTKRRFGEVLGVRRIGDVDLDRASLARCELDHGFVLRFDSTVDRAAEILIEAVNSADVGDGRTPDRGAVKALSNVLDKLHQLRT